MPICAACRKEKGRRQYSHNQLAKGEGRRCKDCISIGLMPAQQPARSDSGIVGGLGIMGRVIDDGVIDDPDHDVPVWQLVQTAARECGVQLSTSISMGTGYIWRGLRSDESPSRLRAKRPSASVGLERALAEGSTVANEFIHCTMSPIAAVFYAAAFSPSGSSSTVVRIDLSRVAASSIIDVSDLQKCIGHGLHPQSVASLFAAGHKVVLLSETVPPEAITAVHEVTLFHGLPRNMRQCSLSDFTEQLPQHLRKEIDQWKPPPTIKELPSWYDIAQLPLRFIWRVENERQARQGGPIFRRLESGRFEYFPAHFAEGIMDELDLRQRHWLLDHGAPRQTQVWHDGQWVQLHPQAGPHIDDDLAMKPTWLREPSFGALHANMAVEFHVCMVITRCWHDGESRESHVSRKCEGGDGESDWEYGTVSPWGKEFIAACRFLEDNYAEHDILVNIRAAAVSSVRSLGLTCELNPDVDDGWDIRF